MIAKNVIEETSLNGHGFLFTVFIVPKKDRVQRPVIITMAMAGNVKALGLGLLCPTYHLSLSTGEQEKAAVVDRSHACLDMFASRLTTQLKSSSTGD